MSLIRRITKDTKRFKNTKFRSLVHYSPYPFLFLLFIFLYFLELGGGEILQQTQFLDVLKFFLIKHFILHIFVIFCNEIISF